METTTSKKAGFAVFAFLFIAILVGSFSIQEWAIEGVLMRIFPNYRIVTDVFSGDWVIITNDVGSTEEYNARGATLNEIFLSIRYNEYSADPVTNAAMGQRKLKEFAFNNRQTLYFVNPYIAFMPMHLFIASVLAFLLSMFIPGASGLSWMRGNAILQHRRVEAILRKQFKAHDMDFDPILDMESDAHEGYIRDSTLPEVVIKEVEDFVAMHRWLQGKTMNPVTPVKFYFRYRISAAYGNLIQGIVSGGAGVLIFIIGLRGLKLIPPEEPSLILMALSLEFILLIILMITFAGSAQEERLDRVVKELEAEQRDAIKQQTIMLKEMLGEFGAATGKGGTESIAEYEERRMLDELLQQMLVEMKRRKDKHGS